MDRGPNPGPFTHWRESRDPLIAAIGRYCSYCESPLSDVDVEHKEPKAEDKYPGRALDWDNFLLACGYCNSVKQAKDTRAERFLFPDEVNTAAAFAYPATGRVEVPAGLDAADAHTARRTRDHLLNLNRIRDTNGNRDLRWSRRQDAWREANQARANLLESDTEPLRRQIVSTALGWGCFSVWMAAFATDPDMRRRFLSAFRGTRTRCYDASGAPLPFR